MKNRTTYFTIALAILSAVAAYFVGQHFGYAQGFRVAYTAEHSHYLYEKKRADKLQRTVANHRRCVEKMAASIPPVQSAGFQGLGETFQRFGLMYWGTVRCNETAGFGFITQTQHRRIIPASGT